MQKKEKRMQNTRQLVTQLMKHYRALVPDHRKEAFEHFLQAEENQELARSIIEQQERLMAKWNEQERIAAIQAQPVRIPNATVGKPYEALLDLDKLGWQDVVDLRLEGSEELGLLFDAGKNLVTGVPTTSGDQVLVLRFRLAGQAPETADNEKRLPFIVNPDPKSLWKDLPSNRDDPYWKEDNVTVFAPLGHRHLLVSSKRGRSHANAGSFREDDFAYRELDEGWCLVTLADGAGSAKAARKGSALACKGVVDYFRQQAAGDSLKELDALVEPYHNDGTEEGQKKIRLLVYNTLGKAAMQVHKDLHGFAQQEGLSLKDLSATLIFTLFKKYDQGYVFLSFGVGDCPIAVLNKDLTAVHLLNWLDVGEFGGGTRFITMPEIFQNEKFYTRFGFQQLDDFSYLVMMTDGIYDPKFVVEAALPNIRNWQAFFADLNGANEEGVKVDLSTGNPEIEQQFSQWMDFWSPGNHDDRTLALVF